jgi:predicted branched-subunit amino acid permease
MRDMLPLFLPAVPFGLVVGLAVAETPVPDWAGWLSGMLMFGGAAQLAAVSLLGAGNPALNALLAATVVNARHLMYSAAMVPHFRSQPTWFRRLGPYLLIDQIFALTSLRHSDPDEWRSYYLGAGVLAWSLWQVVLAVGVLAGAAVPEGLDIEFAVPLLFIGLFGPRLTDRPTVLAAAAGAATTLLLAGLPNRAGMLVGGAVGTLAGTLAHRSRT